MSILGAPRQVSRTFKNIGRIKQISSVFAKHGFQELMTKLGFGRFIPEKYRRSQIENALSAPERLRMAFEELGPTFIKLGQLLSSRSDLLPDSFVQELSKLQDHASPLPFEAIKEVIERELDSSIDDVFAEFQQAPLASASIGQVHQARLKDGTEVVVKVQRPSIDTIIKTDVSVLSGLAAALEKYIPESKVLSPQTCVEEFFHAMSLELDFILEANNILKSQENLRDMPGVYIPKVYLHWCTNRILVVERLHGQKMDDVQALTENGFDRKRLAEITAKAFLKTALEDGFFHGDLHMGNLFALKGLEGDSEHSKVGMIDFGIMGYLTPRARESLIRIFVALSEEDFETLCMEFAELGSSRGQTDFEAFQRTIQSKVAPFLGLPLGAMNVGKILIEATTAAARHHIRIPREWMLIFKAIYTLEGTCRKLDPDFNPMPLLEAHLEPLLRPETNWNKFSKDLLLGSRDIQTIAQTLPRQLHWFFKRLAANGYAIEIKNSDAEKDRRQSKANFQLLATSVVFATSVSGGLYCIQLVLDYGTPLPKIALSALCVSCVWSLMKIFK